MLEYALSEGAREHFEELARGTVRTKGVFDGWPELQASRCQHHFVFSIRRDASPLAILAVLHERRNLPARLRERLQEEGLSG